MCGKRKDETSDAPGSGMRFERADLGGLAPGQDSAAGGWRDPSRIPCRWKQWQLRSWF